MRIVFILLETFCVLNNLSVSFFSISSHKSLSFVSSPPFLSSPCLSWTPLLPPAGFLQITPEGSPQAQRRGEVGGESDVSGSFCLHTSGLDFTSQQTSEEVSSAEEGTHTTVIRTTRITQQLLTSETQTGVSTKTTTTTSRQVTDF